MPGGGLPRLARVSSPDRPQRSRTRKALLVLLVLVGLIVGGLAGFAFLLARTVEGNVSRELTLPSQGPVDEAGVPVPRGAGDNILLIGADARPGDTFSRSDVMVLVHLPEDRSAVQLIHFPRDLFVPIPGHGKNKLNAAYAFGGAPLLIETLQNLTGVTIDHIAMVEFEGFKAMTDAVGGVRVYAEEPSDGSGNGGPVVIRQGWNDLNGEQALFFVRERYQLSQGDISRGRRQMAFVKALMTKALSRETITNPARVLEFTNAATTYLVVDQGFEIAQMRDYAFSLRGIRSKDIVFITAPYSGVGSDPAAGSIVIVDQARMKKLGELVRTDRLGEWSETSVIP